MSKNLKNKIAEGGAVALVVIGILALAYGLSWIVTCGIIKLIMTVDAFNGHINWSVQEGDHYTDFKDFEEARDYYLKVTGN